MKKLDAIDWLYIAGAILVSVGLGIRSIPHALEAAGVFCLFFPVLETAAGFISGTRKSE